MAKEIVEELNMFFKQYEPFSYKKGDIIERPGNIPYYLYYITQGYVKQYARSRYDEELILNIFMPHSYFYAIFQSHDTKHDYYFSPMTDIKGYRAPRDDAIKLLKKNPDIIFDLLYRSQYGIIGMFSRMESLVFGNSYSKVAASVLMCANRFGKKKETSDHIVLQLPLTHKDLGSIAGVTRETVTAELMRLRKNKIIEINHHVITVLQIEELIRASLLNQAQEHKWHLNIK